MDLEKELKSLKDRIAKLEKSSNKMFGSSYSDVGSSSSDFLIKTKGKVKIQWGSKFIDLLKDGELNVDAKFIYSGQEVGSKDGIYIVGTGEETQVVLVSGGQQIELKGAGEGTTYVSFLEEQKTTAEQKYRALTNIGFVYPNLDQVPNFDSGIIYVEETQKLYVISNGSLSEYSFEFPNPYTETFTIQKNNNVQGAIVIKGTSIANSLAFDSMYIYSDTNSNYIDSEKDLLIKTNGEEKITIGQSSTSFKNKIIVPSIESTGATATSGFKLSISQSKSLLEVDSINVRDGLNIKMPRDIYTKYWYNEVNYIKTANDKSDSEEKKFILTLVNINTFKINDVLCVCIESKSETSTGEKVKTEEYKNLIVTDLNQTDNKITVKDLSKSIGATTLTYQSIFLVYREGGINLLKRNGNNLDLVSVSALEDESNLTKINSRFGDLTELNLTGKVIDSSGTITNPNITGLGIYSNSACFKNIQYTSDYILESDDKSTKLASTEWVYNKINSQLPIGSIIMYGKTEIPEGWHICDGTDGTPNLVNSFIKDLIYIIKIK